jgi:retron-type reverse transcriptase
LFNILVEFGIIVKPFPGTFPSKKGLKQGDALSPLLFNIALQCVNRKVQADQEGLKLNRAHRLLVYADDVNLLDEKIL